MSSLSCVSGLCTFTRVDTNVPAWNSMPRPEIFQTLSPTIVSDNGPGNDGAPTLSPSALRGGTGSPSWSALTTVPLETELEPSIAPWFDVLNQDVLSDSVAITRGSNGGIFNARIEGDEFNTYYSAPTGTLWALLPEGQTFEEARCSLEYCEWNACFAQYDPATMLNKPGVVRLVEEDVYYNIKFTQWTEETNDAVNSSTNAPIASDKLGGGFQYIRDEFPIVLQDSVACPKCDLAKASPAVLTGPVDFTMRSVAIAGVANTTIAITAVAQERSQQYNAQNLPNAAGLGNSTVQLRRSKYMGELTPFYYTVYFTATNAAGTCRGEVRVCSPADGFDCDTSFGYGYDATTTEHVPV